ncbi:hypothetical protein CCACVL1_05050 [Corchorus capsularis]|uniref:Uncharacterized protein n=1 Tax=Corchorus capsularis TaxID=210143 RepID=A0A1R3JMS1_COCAP|nr:hypothetical protein CCACVL1_05050 [Corchorus capsularis]
MAIMHSRMYRGDFINRIISVGQLVCSSVENN